MAHAKHGGGSGLQLLDAWLLLILWEVLREDSLVPGKDVRLSEGPLVHILDFLVQIFGGLIHGGSKGVVGKVQTGVHVADVSDELSLQVLKLGNVLQKPFWGFAFTFNQCAK